MWNAARHGLKALSRRGGAVVPSPNIWYFPDVYELENRAQDVGDEVWRVLEEETSWSGRDVVDLGCGDGFHLPRFAETASSVVGVEPHEPLVHKARRRISGAGNIRVLPGSAQRIPLADASADVVHARTAYFFGPGCEPGMREADRVLRPGGALAIVDLDATVEPYGRWMRADLPHYDPAAVESFFARNGFRCRRVLTRWHFAERSVLEAVLKIEFSPKVAGRAVDEVIAARPGGGYTLPVGYRVHVREKPTGLVLPGHSSSSSSASTSPRMV